MDKQIGFVVMLLISFIAAPCALGSGKEAFNMVHDLTEAVPEMSVNQNFDLQIFCKTGERKTPIYFFRSATLRINSGAEDVKLIKGPTAEIVYKQYKSSTWLFWVANLMPWRMRDASFPTFNSSCVGISTDQPYVAKLVIRYVDPWKFTIFCVGLILYFMSPKLAKSTMFFYSSATLVGALGAALLLIFLVTRFLPRGRGSYLTMGMLYSMMLYFAGETWSRFEEHIQERLPYVILYLLAGALISLISCYRLGPPSNERTLNILQWGLQAAGLGLIHLSSDLVEVSTCIIIGLVVYNICAEYFWRQARKIKFKLFPPKRKLLTEDEYNQQAAIETEKGLEQLRKFCNSPECKSWRVVGKLKDPKRFSSFVEGDSHLKEEEIFSYESDNEALEEAAAADLFTDDESNGNITDDD